MNIQQAQLTLNKAALKWYHLHKTVYQSAYEQKLGEACYEYERAVNELGVSYNQAVGQSYLHQTDGPALDYPADRLPDDYWDNMY